MTALIFQSPTLETARERLATLLAGYGAATGFPETLVGKIARGDPKCAAAFRSRDFLHGSYDLVVSRLSALWPEGAEWPADVPRQAPAVIEPEILQLIADRRDRKASTPRPAAEPLPEGAEWPADIPRPGTADKLHGEANG